MPAHCPAENTDKDFSNLPWLMFLFWVLGYQPYGLGCIWIACRKCCDREESTSRKLDAKVCVYKRIQVLVYITLKQFFFLNLCMRNRKQRKQNTAVCQAIKKACLYCYLLFLTLCSYLRNSTECLAIHSCVHFDALLFAVILPSFEYLHLEGKRRKRG